MKLIFVIISLVFLSNLNAQNKFKVEQKETETWRNIYSLIDEKNNLIIVLDSSKYFTTFDIDNYVYFAIFSKKGSPGWSAIDSNENILFQVYNTSFGEPTPDYLIENKIRIIDNDNKIGFANEKGKIIIKPKFEIVTSFHNGKAIIGQSCDKIPWDANAKEDDCHHYSIVCKKYGYINELGEIVESGFSTFEEIQNKINWKAPEE
jgi:hypothetical protein